MMFDRDYLRNTYQYSFTIASDQSTLEIWLINTVAGHWNGSFNQEYVFVRWYVILSCHSLEMTLDA